MPGITGQATTYNLPNYVGELFQISPEDTPFLSAIGGLSGGMSVGSTVFSWQAEDLREPEAGRQRLEGGKPSFDGRSRVNATNVVEIHQEGVEVSYTRQGATRQVTTDGKPVVWLGGTAVPADELAHQIDLQLKQVARDVELSFIQGTFQQPTDNTQPRKTRGLLEAIETNRATTTHTADNLEAGDVLDLMELVWNAGGIKETETRTIMVGSKLKRALTRAFVTDAKYQEQSRNVGGVNLQYIETDFGRTNIMLNRWMPADTLAVVSLEQCKPAFLEIPGKGHFFVEPLAKTGASDAAQLYGEIGLVYGNERAHGVLTVAA
ncbi:DUF5309 family protein [Actinobaculum sp. 352]|uniref:SU10 major capsid protein n=1 Tax=Actinobaculum sp. 352 TaxID=2490946 RepID=UPI000F7E23A7|nr:DUF5309 family protein [Actinobaculum sp. 352]RTE48821.1 hypothetical protein EKN07_08950 [Actinobaculum sp. 352]